MNEKITSRNTPRILVVDDTAANLQLLTNLLKEQRYTVHPASDGELALEFVRSTLPDLILLDIRMPGIDGYEVCRRLKSDERTRAIPVIFISVLEDERDKVKGFREGAVDYITKPFQPEEVLARVGIHLRLRELTERLEQKVNERTEELGTANQLLRQEIAERKAAEESLRKSEEKYRRIVDTANEGIWVLGPDTMTTFVNARMAEMLGYRTEEMLGRPLTDFMFKEDAHDHLRRMENRRTGISENYERRFLRKDGQSIWTLVSATPIFDEKHRFQGAFGMHTDITERKAAEETLLKLSTGIEQSPVSIIITNVNGTIEYVNPKFSELSGYRAEEVLGKKPSILKSGITQQREYNDLWGSIAAGKVWKGTFCNRKKNGALFWQEATITPVKDKAGTITHYIAIEEDITEKRKLEDQLRQVQKMEAIGTLAGGVAHDFNNILTAITGYGSILRAKTKPDDPQRSFIDPILSSAERAAQLTRALLAFSRKQVINLQPIDINEVVRNIEKLLRRLIGEDIELITRTAEQSLIIMADAGQIEQVLMNFATNARDAMPNGGVLEISAQENFLNEAFVSAHGYGRAGQYAMLTISDTGMGMDEETRSKIFEPFFTTKEPGKGTGLGLSIVYGIVKQHEGNISVYSEPGKGTTFKIYFPLISAAVETREPEAFAAPARGSETILIAEDEPNIRKLNANVFREFGYRVIEAVDGEDALHQYNEHANEIDLLMLDVIMPQKNGKEVADAVKLQRPELPVLFTSGYADDFIRKRGVLAEKDEFVSKPITPFEVLRKIRQMLDAAQSKKRKAA